jgi:GNAT superfamily N-acetyltransferase
MINTSLACESGVRNPASADAFEVRPATEQDVPVLLKMVRELAGFEELTEEVHSSEASLHAALFGDNPVAEALIAEQNGEPAGYAVFYHTFSTFVGKPGLWLEDVFVRPAYREAGLGRALLETVAQIGMERGCERYEWSALRWNENALEFYSGLGTKVMSDWVLLRTTARGMCRLARSLEESA